MTREIACGAAKSNAQDRRAAARGASIRGLGLLALIPIACGGGRSSMPEDEGTILEPPLGSGGASGGYTTTTATSKPRGGSGGFGSTTVGSGNVPIASGGRAVGGFGGRAAGGYFTGGKAGAAGGFGGRAAGGSGGRAAGGYFTGGKAGAAGKWTGGSGGISGGGGTGGGGTSGVAGATSVTCKPSRYALPVGAAGASFIGAPPPIGGTFGSAGVSGVAGAFTFAGATGIETAAGASGLEASSDWYVDAKRGSDTGPGTLTAPLRTLACAALAARSGETVRLLDGTWDRSVDPKLGDGSSTACGLSSGIAFAPNVNVLAVHAGAAQIKAGGYHNVCMSGGSIDGVRFTCNLGRPAIETTQGSLSISNSDFFDCPPFALDIAGSASVTLSPGSVSDYLGGAQVGLAYVRENAALSVEGGTLSYESRAFLVEGNASLTLEGVRIQPPLGSSSSGPAVNLGSGTPHLTITGNTSFDGASIAVYGYDSQSTITVDGMSVVNGGNAFIVNEPAGSVVPKIVIDHLTVSDSSGLGVDVSGTFELAVTNSSFTRVGAPAVMPSGTGTVTLDNLKFTDGWGALLFSGGVGYALGLDVRVRNILATRSQCAAVSVTAGSNDAFDFGTAASPGNNIFSGNNLASDAACANFVFDLPAGMVISAVGNTWDANLQGADASGHYSSASGVLVVSGGAGPNYLARAGNLGQLRLAVGP